jgi:diguanylate cyclase (GGDEF)-like protein
MMAQGDTLGLLYLYFQNTDNIAESVTELGETVAQNIAMAIANLQLQDTLRYQSLRDPLTGLFNRRYLEESLTKEIDRAKRKQQFIGIMMMDIDHFKRFNDTYGHEVGDVVLKKVGNYLLKKIRQYDLACRYGGEELVIIMPGASLENSIFRAEEIREGIKQLKLEHEGVKLAQVTVSIGVSCFPDDGTNASSLIRVADKALYRAKQQGRDRVVCC